jgi:acyl-ACP thioesterase
VEEQGEVKTRLGKAPPKTRGDYAPDGRSYLEEYDLTHCETTPMAGGGSSATSPPVISPIVVTKMIEAVAIGHFQKLSGDYSDVPRSKEMNELNLTFMLSRITFEFSDLPQRDQVVETETLFKPQRVSFKRDFAVRNKTNGSVVAAATSTYVLVNFVTRKLSVAPKEVVDLYKDTMSKDTSRLGVNLPRKSKLSAFTSEEGELTKSYVVEESDIDLNGHVGASVYINWILDSAQMTSLSSLKTLDIEYKQECFVGQDIECYIQVVPLESGEAEEEEGERKKEIHHLVQTKQGEILLRAKSRWALE